MGREGICWESDWRSQAWAPWAHGRWESHHLNAWEGLCGRWGQMARFNKYGAIICVIRQVAKGNQDCSPTFASSCGILQTFDILCVLSAFECPQNGHTTNKFYAILLLSSKMSLWRLLVWCRKNNLLEHNALMGFQVDFKFQHNRRSNLGFGCVWKRPEHKLAKEWAKDALYRSRCDVG